MGFNPWDIYVPGYRKKGILGRASERVLVARCSATPLGPQGIPLEYAQIYAGFSPGGLQDLVICTV